MQGDLSNVNIAELLLNLHQSRRTGILRLTQGEVKKGIYFKDGSIVFAHSNLKTERLGETLLRLGKITDEEFRVASVEVIERGKRLGHALHEKGFVSFAEVNAGVNYQLQQIVYSVFNWDHGEYEFVDRERPVYEDLMVDVSTPSLLIEGVRHTTNPLVVERIIGKEDQLIVEQNIGIMRFSRISLDLGEETILACIAERPTIARLKSLCRLAPLEFGRGMYGLLLSGMIRIRSATPEEAQEIASRKERKPQPQFNTQRMPSDRPVTPSARKPSWKTFSEPEMRRLIIETAAKFHDMTDEEVLGVLPDCTSEEIGEGYEKQTAIFYPPLFSEERYKDLKAKLKFISERLTQAHANLMHKAASRLPYTGQMFPAAPPDAQIKHEPRAEIASMIAVAALTELKTAEIEEKLKKDPVNTELLRLLGKKLQERGKAREAEKRLLRALEIEPKSVENHFALADFYQLQGLKFKAFRHLNIVLELQPNNERAMDLLSIKKKKKALFEISRD